MDIYDLIIIGGGPGGYNAAEKAAHEGLKTLLFEKRSLGGVCLNEGCIPSKALLNSAKIFDYARHSEAYGVTAKDAKLDQKTVISRKDKVVKNLVAGVTAKLKKAGVTVVNATALIKGKALGAFTVEAEGAIYGAKNLLICSGSSAIVPPIGGAAEGLKDGFVLTNREILSLSEIPSSLVIIGGGVIGLEMADYYNSAGSKVTVVEMLDKIAGATDGEISKILQGNMEKRGVVFRLSSKVTAIGKNSVDFENESGKHSVKCDKVLLSIGRKPQTSALGLESLGVLLERGAIVTDEQMQTNIPGVYAAGDVNGKSMLAHTAYREGEVAVNNILGNKDAMHYNAIGSVIYTHPEAASVGETAESAEKKGYGVKTVKLTMNYSGRYMAETENGDGICKVVLDKKSSRILGVHLISPYASEIIFGAALMIESLYDAHLLKKLVFPHPTCGEIIRECLMSN